MSSFYSTTSLWLIYSEKSGSFCSCFIVAFGFVGSFFTFILENGTYSSSSQDDSLSLLGDISLVVQSYVSAKTVLSCREVHSCSLKSIGGSMSVFFSFEWDQGDFSVSYGEVNIYLCCQC